MPEHSGEVGVSCSDCYFRQELLCALKTERVCPTFRRTVRRDQVATAAMVSIPQPGVVHRVEAVEALAFDARPSTDLIEKKQSPCAVVPTRDATPLFDHEPMVSETPQSPARAAAATRTDATEISIEIDVDPDQITLSDEKPQSSRSLTYTDQRRTRITSRVAERYPGALQSC